MHHQFKLHVTYLFTITYALDKLQRQQCEAHLFLTVKRFLYASMCAQLITKQLFGRKT